MCGWWRRSIFCFSCQLQQGDEIGHSKLPSCFKYSSKPPTPSCYYFCCYNSPTFMERRERMGRCIIEQCQELRLETAQYDCSTSARWCDSKDRKVIYHWQDGWSFSMSTERSIFFSLPLNSYELYWTQIILQTWAVQRFTQIRLLWISPLMLLWFMAV